MTLHDLKKLVAELEEQEVPDFTPILVSSDDHSYREVRLELAEAVRNLRLQSWYETPPTMPEDEQVRWALVVS